MENKKAYIDEVEFNREVIARSKTHPTIPENDSPGDSDDFVEEEIEMGVEQLAESEPDEVVGMTDESDGTDSDEPGVRSD